MITYYFTCTSTNVIYFITCNLCQKLYIGETGRRLHDRFQKHLRDVQKFDENAAKQVARHFNRPNHFKQHIAVWAFPFIKEARKAIPFILQIGTLNPNGINEHVSFD